MDEMSKKAMLQGFNSELEKISGEMHGFTRIGRKPIGVERMLERETEGEPPSALFSSGEAKEAAVAKAAAEMAKYKVPATLLAGAGSYHILRKANEDRKLGRQVRLQNQ
jgi:hypothetical protein